MRVLQCGQREGGASILSIKALTVVAMPIPTQMTSKVTVNAKWGYSLLLRADPGRIQEAVQFNREAVTAYQEQGRRPKYELAHIDLQQVLLLSESSRVVSPTLEVPNEKDAVEPAMRRDRVFISYSHADSEWLRPLRIHLRPLERMEVVDIFDDSKIHPGDRWKQEIRDKVGAATVALLLVSADFLASDFIQDNELPTLLKLAEEQGARIIPIILSACGFEETEDLNQFQAANSPDLPLISLSKNDQETILARVANTVRATVKGHL